MDKYTQASYVITDLIKQTIKEKFKMDLEGATVYHVSEPDVDPPYAYMMTGTEANSFYLAQVYWPDQTKAQVAKYIQNYADWTTDGYKDGKYLGEFDYCDKSGWMYSIADRTTGNPSFPGVALRTGDCLTAKSCAGSSQFGATVPTWLRITPNGASPASHTRTMALPLATRPR